MWIKDFVTEQDNPLRTPPFVIITHLCYNDALPSWEYPLHSHENEFEVGFIMKGDGLFTVNEKDTVVHMGDICIIPPCTYHFFSGKSMEYFTMRFDADPATGTLQSFFRETGPAITPGGDYFSYITDTCHLLLGLHMTNGGFADERVQTICLSMLQIVQMLLENRTLAIHTRSDSSMNDVLHYITDHCEDKISLQSLGEKFSISPSHLSRLFSRAFHCSPINYLINARMARATEYLGKTDKSVSEIAELVGYDNPFYFASLFTKRIGCSPTEYRQRLDSRDLPRNSPDIVYHKRKSPEESK
ncbi:MAG: AraC family transcriptional regulator [Lachnospiraceae bacterium]|nr:AraC family transcriptional regulator [Lachnospiraceae bacterium]